MALLTFTDRGIYCAQADVYIDPWKKVNSALITHAHSDHARRGSNKYLATHLTVPILKHRLGRKHIIEGVSFREKINMNGVEISFHPAGHIIGSAQVRLEYKGEVWVVSGDYKIENDGLATPFETVKCHNFITESTFGLPIYKWRPQSEVMAEINDWWMLNAEEQKISLLNAYSLGKAQRLAFLLDHSIGKVYLAKSVFEVHEIFRNNGIALKQFQAFYPEQSEDIEPGSLIIGPGSISECNWGKKVQGLETASASGWMQVRNLRKRRSIGKGFVLSDHADWPGILQAIKSSEADKVYVTHGYAQLLSRYLNESGIASDIVQTEYSPGENE